jgi:hypothetical protein
MIWHFLSKCKGKEVLWGRRCSDGVLFGKLIPQPLSSWGMDEIFPGEEEGSVINPFASDNRVTPSGIHSALFALTWTQLNRTER